MLTIRKHRMTTIAEKPEIEALWRASLNYAEMAAKTLVTESPSEEDDYESALELLVLRLKTAFLFPLLEESDKLLLEEAYLHTKIVTTGVNFRRGAISEALLTNAEVNYIDTREKVESRLFDKMTEAQKEIVKEFYLKVQFAEV